MKKEQRIAVTGARGLLGSALLQVVERSFALRSDIRDKKALEEEVEVLNPSWIIHAAAMTDVGACERNPDDAHAVNAEGTTHVVDVARKIGARVIYISTASVFKGDAGDYREDDIPESLNVYNQTKREGELTTLAYEKGMVIRLNVIGIHPDGSRGKNFFEWLVDSVRTNKDIALFSDSFINPLSNWTIAEYIKEIIDRDCADKILHIGSRDVVSKADIGELVIKCLPQYSGSVNITSIDSIADGVIRPKQMWLNTDYAVSIFGSMPTVADEIKVIMSRENR